MIPELKPVTAADAEAIYAVVERNREHLREWLPWATPEYSLENTRGFAAEQERENAARTALASGIWVDGALLGMVAFHHIDAPNRATSIGYWLDAACERKGIMTQACRAMVDLAFREYGLHRIEIRCAAGNARSAAIPLRLGFTEEGTLRDAQWLQDRWVDLRVFSMLERDWK